MTGITIIEYSPEQCEYCGRVTGLSEHHLIRRSDGGTKGPTIWLCYQCHDKATNDKDFEILLQKIFITYNKNEV